MTLRRRPGRRRLTSLVVVLCAQTVLAQQPATTFADEGAVAGRVCVDTDGDRTCGPDEPGLAGARVVAETGLWVVSDSEGRFHLAGLGTRAIVDAPGSPFGPGTHRLAVDLSEQPVGTVAAPAASTVEVPQGGLAWVEFAVRLPARDRAAAIDARPPGLRVRAGKFEIEVRVAVAGAGRLVIGEQECSLDAEGGSAWVSVVPGANVVPVLVESAAGSATISTLRLDVLRRGGGVMVLPRALESRGRLELPPAGGGLLQLDLTPGLSVSVDDLPLALSPDGKASRPMDAGHVARIAVVVDGGPPWRFTLSPRERRGAFAVGLLDVEAGLRLSAPGGITLAGRGAAAGRAARWGFELSAEVDLRDADLEALPSRGGAVLAPRRVDRFERMPDNGLMPVTFSDGSATLASNVAESPLRFELSRPGVGRLGYGGVRSNQAEGEVGRFHRVIEGAFLDVALTAGERLGVELEAAAAPRVADLRTDRRRSPGHDRFGATGGSLFFLAHGDLVAGSDYVRVEWRDAFGAPVGERHLLRGRDYAIDALSGRIILAEPLSFFVAPSLLATDALTSGSAAVLVVDYEFLEQGLGDAVTAAQLRLRAGPLKGGVAWLREAGSTLWSARASATLGGVHLSVEGARSEGLLHGQTLSDDGGFTFAAREGGRGGSAFVVRARGAALFGKGSFDLAGRLREPGYSDASAGGELRQLALRLDQPLGDFSVAALFDHRDGEDARLELTGRHFAARTAGGAVGYGKGPFRVRLEVRDSEATTDLEGAAALTGGRTSVGAAGRYELAPGFSVVAAHRQRVASRGAGEGAWDDTFTSAGVDAELTKGTVLGLRAGYGPTLGPQAWGQLSSTRGDETWYGQHSLDVDSPSGGARRMVTGVRKDLGSGTAVFVEDVAAHDVGVLRLGRAVAVSQKLSDALTVSARYERGLRTMLDTAPRATRDSGGVTASWEAGPARVWARGEGRAEQGGASLTQWFGSAGAETTFAGAGAAAARVVFTHATREGRLESRLVDATASVSWRFSSGLVVARYSSVRELLPARRDGGGERQVQVLSLLPAVRFGSRWALAAGLHVAPGPDQLTLAASVRPSVVIVEGLDAAVELARRSSAPEGGEVSAVRGEVGYRFLEQRLRLAAGYTFFGFSGTGVDSGAPGAAQRAYLRAEVAL